VKLMARRGENHTHLWPNGPYDYYNITVIFRQRPPTRDTSGAIVREGRGGRFLGNRYLEVIKGRAACND